MPPESDRVLLARIDERTKDLPKTLKDLGEKIDKIHATNAVQTNRISVLETTWKNIKMGLGAVGTVTGLVLTYLGLK